jgi:hypothetical protein
VSLLIKRVPWWLSIKRDNGTNNRKKNQAALPFLWISASGSILWFPAMVLALTIMDPFRDV